MSVPPRISTLLSAHFVYFRYIYLSGLKSDLKDDTDTIKILADKGIDFVGEKDIAAIVNTDPLCIGHVVTSSLTGHNCEEVSSSPSPLSPFAYLPPLLQHSLSPHRTVMNIVGEFILTGEVKGRKIPSKKERKPIHPCVVS